MTTTARTVCDALRPPSDIGMKLCLIPGPAGLSSQHLTGRCGIFHHLQRRLVYLKRGRSMTWFEWRDHQPMLPGLEDAYDARTVPNRDREGAAQPTGAAQ